MPFDPGFDARVWDKRMTEWVRREGIIATRRTYNRTRFHLPWHRHVGIEILYCDLGEGVLAVGQNVFPYSIGTLALFHSETPHRVRMRSAYARWNLCFLPEAVGLENFLPAQLLNGLSIGNPQNAYLARINRDEDDQRIRSLFADLHREATERRKGFERILALRLCELLLLFERFLEQSVALSDAARPPAREPRFREILAYVENNLSGNLSVQSIAQRFHLSDSHLYRLMYLATGQSPSQYIISRRIARARELLANSSLTIAETARAVGITNTSYFSQLFKRHVGLTPRRTASVQPMPKPFPVPDERVRCGGRRWKIAAPTPGRTVTGETHLPRSYDVPLWEGPEADLRSRARGNLGG